MVVPLPSSRCLPKAIEFVVTHPLSRGCSGNGALDTKMASEALHAMMMPTFQLQPMFVKCRPKWRLIGMTNNSNIDGMFCLMVVHPMLPCALPGNTASGCFHVI